MGIICLKANFLYTKLSAKHHILEMAMLLMKLTKNKRVLL